MDIDMVLSNDTQCNGGMIIATQLLSTTTPLIEETLCSPRYQNGCHWLDLGETIGTDNSLAKKRPANEDQSPDDILAHESAKMKQRSWLRQQNKKAKMQAWKLPTGLDAPTTTIPPTT